MHSNCDTVFTLNAALEKALEWQKNGYSTVEICHVTGDVYEISNASGWPFEESYMWTYDQGVEGIAGTSDIDHSRILEPCESLETFSHILWHFPQIPELLEADDSAINFGWAVVDSYCEDATEENDWENCGGDHAVGHIYLIDRA